MNFLIRIFFSLNFFTIVATSSMFAAETNEQVAEKLQSELDFLKRNIDVLAGGAKSLRASIQKVEDASLLIRLDAMIAEHQEAVKMLEDTENMLKQIKANFATARRISGHSSKSSLQ